MIIFIFQNGQKLGGGIRKPKNKETVALHNLIQCKWYQHKCLLAWIALESFDN